MSETRNDVAGTPVDGAAPDHSATVSFTYMIGTYLAVNAIQDAWLLVEGPDCVHLKTQFVQGNHDWLSTLTSVSGFHRVANTALHPSHMTGSREKALAGALERIAAHPATAGVLLTSMPMAFVTGADYERLCREAAAKTGKTVALIPGKSLSGDWLDGYAETLYSLARSVDLAGGAPDPKKVAIVGHLFDRNEEDQRANVRDLRALLESLGLEVVSVWLEGQRFAELGAVKDAGLILSFPYARKAAKWIGRRTGARVVECDLPFGLAATERWLRQVGREVGCEARADEVIDRHLAALIPRLEWVIPFVFQNRRFGWVGDPFLARGFREIAELLGAHVPLAVITNPERQVGPLRDEYGPDARVLVSPLRNTMVAFLREAVPALGVTLLVTNNAGVGVVPVASVEFGFPSLYQHALYDRPFLGFNGFMAFVDTLANAIRHQEVVEARTAGAWTRHRLG